MTDWRTMHDAEWLYAFHLEGREVTVTISRVEAGEVIGEQGRRAKKPVVYFRGKKLPLALNKTNCKIIAKLYGNAIEAWVGKAITIYPTTTDFGGKTVECIRIRPIVPRKQQDAQEPEQPAPQEPTNG